MYRFTSNPPIKTNRKREADKTASRFLRIFYSHLSIRL